MPTTVAAARATARRWVEQHAARMSGFVGAFHTGSICTMAPDDVLPATSDVDIAVVLTSTAPAARPASPRKLGKFHHDDVVLDVSFRAVDEVATPERVLANPHLVRPLATGAPIADPTGRLTAVATAVAVSWAQRHWVRARCAALDQRVRDRLGAAREDRPFAAQVLTWVFPTAVLAHLPLVADLRNPTVRRRYVDAAQVLEAIGRPDAYGDLLALLGCAGMDAATVRRHLDALRGVFAIASPHAAASTLPFASDVGVAARTIALDGSAELIAGGWHREAVFWIVASYARCLLVLDETAPAVAGDLVDGFRDLTEDLGVGTVAALHRRRRATLDHLAVLQPVVEQIMAANPRIR